jgi:hypothetical protein
VLKDREPHERVVDRAADDPQMTEHLRETPGDPGPKEQRRDEPLPEQPRSVAWCVSRRSPGNRVRTEYVSATA